MDTLKIYIINLKKSIERKEHMESQLLKLGLINSSEFIEAVDGSLLSENIYSELIDEKLSQFIIQRSLTRGEVGCYLSHFKIYKKMMEENLKYSIVFEDDVYINDKLLEFIKVINFINPEIDYINFANFPESSIFFKSERLVSSNFCLKKHVEGIWGTYGYYISLAGAKKLIASDVSKTLVPIDYLCRSFGKEKLDMRVLHPHIVKTSIPQIGIKSIFPSIIEEDRQNIEKINFKINKFKVFLKRVLAIFTV